MCARGVRVRRCGESCVEFFCKEGLAYESPIASRNATKNLFGATRAFLHSRFCATQTWPRAYQAPSISRQLHSTPSAHLTNTLSSSLLFHDHPPQLPQMLLLLLEPLPLRRSRSSPTSTRLTSPSPWARADSGWSSVRKRKGAAGS